MNAPPPRLFYDGRCALCHRAVGLTLGRDRGRPPLRASPLCGEASRRWLGEDRLAGLPDSVVVLTPAGELLVRSRATLFLMRRMGGGWRLLAALAALLPAGLTDRLYDAVASRRRRWFGRTDEVCPALPPELLDRFDP